MRLLRNLRLCRLLATPCFSALVLLFLLSAASAGPKKTHTALIKAWTVKLRSGPGAQHKMTALLDTGRSARVVGRKGEWVKLRLGTGRVGWVRGDLLTVSRKATRDPDVSSDESRHRARRTEKVARRSERPKSAHPKPARVAKAAPKPKPAKTASRQQVAKAAPARPTPTPSRAPAATPAPPEEKTEAPAAAEADGDAPAAAREEGSTTPERVAMASAPRDVPAPPRSATRVQTLSRRDSSRGERLTRRALAFRGLPYRSGAASGNAFDCSGFVQYLYAHEGRDLPRTAAEQFQIGTRVDRSSLKPGDLVFFRNTYKAGISHVGVYIGNGRFIHASGYGRGIRVDSLSKDYYLNHWAGARRPR